MGQHGNRLGDASFFYRWGGQWHHAISVRLECDGQGALQKYDGSKKNTHDRRIPGAATRLPPIHDSIK